MTKEADRFLLVEQFTYSHSAAPDPECGFTFIHGTAKPYLLHNLVLNHHQACFLPSGDFNKGLRSRIFLGVLLAE